MSKNSKYGEVFISYGYPGLHLETLRKLKKHGEFLLGRAGRGPDIIPHSLPLENAPLR
jgi:hypothetical protein